MILRNYDFDVSNPREVAQFIVSSKMPLDDDEQRIVNRFLDDYCFCTPTIFDQYTVVVLGWQAKGYLKAKGG